MLLTMVLSGLVVSQALRKALESDLRNTTLEKLSAVRHIIEDRAEFLSENQLHAIDDLLAGHPDMSVVLTIANQATVRGAALSPALVATIQEVTSTSTPKVIANGTHMALKREALSSGDRSLGIAILISTKATQDRVGTYRQIVFAATAAALGAGLFLSWVAAKWTMLPLKRLTRSIGQLDPSQLYQRVAEVDDAVELRSITRALNQCLDRIERAYVQTEAFNSDVAHELRTPLAATRLAIESAINGSVNNDVIDLLERAQDQINSLNTIVSDMLFVSQAQRGARARKEWVENSEGLMRSIAEFWEPLAQDQGLALKVTGSGSICLDISLIRRAVSNLISNALRYARTGSEVELRLRANSDEWVISVTNEGQTIPRDVQARMFDRFYRADPARHATATHHGLGLAIVAAVAKMHDGEPFVDCHDTLVSVGLRAPNRTIL